MKAREREIKLAAPPDFELPPLTDVEGLAADPAETLELHATYYDTYDLRLARGGTTVRFRSDEGWLVKLPAAPDDDDGSGVLSRDEHRFDGGPGDLPADALALVRSRVRSAQLDPVATLHTRRRRVVLRDLAGGELAEVVDDTVDVLDGSSEVERFRELEVELAPEISRGQRDGILVRLRDAGAGAADPTPKLVRALGSRAGAPPDVDVPAVDREQIDLVVRAALAAAVAKVVAHDPGVRLGDDAEDVHQARVASRRLRSHLRTFRSLVDERWAEALRDELRWLGEILGGVRDTDVLLERLGAKVEQLGDVDREAADALLDHLRADGARRRELLLEGLDSDRYLVLLDRLVDAARRPRLLLRVDDDQDSRVLCTLVREPWERLERAVDRLSDDPPDDDLHQVRIRTKRARYAAEAVEPAFGKPARAFARALTDVQDVLGEHQDAVVAAEWLRATAARLDDETVGFAAGLLAGLEHRDARTARDEWPAAWKRASRPRLRKWL